jgi:biotin carboxyl carrier protein
MKYQIVVGEETYEVEINDIKDGIAQVTVNADPYDVVIVNWPEVAASRKLSGSPTVVSPGVLPRRSADVAPAPPKVEPVSRASIEGGTPVRAPIPGMILDVKVAPGDVVTAGQVLATMEAMKMENNIMSPISGTVREARVQKGAEVATGDVLFVIS